MVHRKQGNAPEIDTPTSDNGLTTPHSQPVTILTQNATKIIAVYARIKRAIVRFCTLMAVAVRGLS